MSTNLAALSRMPALLKNASSRPNSASTVLNRRAIVVGLADVGLDGDGLAAGLADVGDDGLGAAALLRHS